MAVRIRPPAEADVLAMYRADGTAFGSQWKPADIERTRPTIELDRFRIAVDGDDVVGTAGSFRLDMTPRRPPLADEGDPRRHRCT
jgi:hypothetical protein